MLALALNLVRFMLDHVAKPPSPPFIVSGFVRSSVSIKSCLKSSCNIFFAASLDLLDGTVLLPQSHCDVRRVVAPADEHGGGFGRANRQPHSTPDPSQLTADALIHSKFYWLRVKQLTSSSQFFFSVNIALIMQFLFETCAVKILQCFISCHLIYFMCLKST